jgi:hypothetical protein
MAKKFQNSFASASRVIPATAVHQRDDIQEMAETFDPRVYGCRINLEHLRGCCRMAYSSVMAMWSS